MSAQNEINIFEKKLESLIKNAFKKTLKIVDEFEIAADYDTHYRIENIVKGLGLTVYGMSVTPSEFTITFKFTGLYLDMECLKKPNYCRINFSNDGNYFFNLSESDLKKNWYCGITDIHFNTKYISEELVLDTLKKMNQVLIMTILSN